MVVQWQVKRQEATYYVAAANLTPAKEDVLAWEYLKQLIQCQQTQQTSITNTLRLIDIPNRRRLKNILSSWG